MKTGTTRIDHELLDQVVHKSHTADGATVEVFSYMKTGTTRIDHGFLTRHQFTNLTLDGAPVKVFAI
jgi:hypothetical protein